MIAVRMYNHRADCTVKCSTDDEHEKRKRKERNTTSKKQQLSFNVNYINTTTMFKSETFLQIFFYLPF